MAANVVENDRLFVQNRIGVKVFVEKRKETKTLQYGPILYGLYTVNNDFRVGDRLAVSSSLTEREKIKLKMLYMYQLKIYPVDAFAHLKTVLLFIVEIKCSIILT